jgi:hypothetical protein
MKMMKWSSLMHSSTQEESNKIYLVFFEFPSNLHEFWKLQWISKKRIRTEKGLYQSLGRKWSGPTGKRGRVAGLDSGLAQLDWASLVPNVVAQLGSTSSQGGRALPGSGGLLPPTLLVVRCRAAASNGRRRSWRTHFGVSRLRAFIEQGRRWWRDARRTRQCGGAAPVDESER